jgi:hypothetical protein
MPPSHISFFLKKKNPKKKRKEKKKKYAGVAMGWFGHPIWIFKNKNKKCDGGILGRKKGSK